MTRESSAPKAPTAVTVVASDRVGSATTSSAAVEPAARGGEVHSSELSEVIDAGSLPPMAADRVFKTAQPGPGVPALSIVGVSAPRIPCEGNTLVAVRGVAGEPVTFLVREGGQFANGQAVITVRANADGVARTRYTATPGAVDDVAVIAGSPATSGTVDIIIHVLYPGSRLADQPASTTTAP